MARKRSDELQKGDAPVVGILTGSPSDLPTVQKAEEVLHGLGIPCEVHAMSAHRTPDLVVGYVSTARGRGIEVIIACAGMAAHLAGVVAAHTTLPVIGVPLASGALSGLDALLATVQMPPGVPVATVGVDGTRNAGFLAARILAGRHPELVARIEEGLAKDRARYATKGNSPRKRSAAKRASGATARSRAEPKKARAGTARPGAKRRRR